MPELTSKIDLSRVLATKTKVESERGHFYLKKHIDGEFHLGGSPMFIAALSSQQATFTIGADVSPVLCGKGIYATPLRYLTFGVMSCFASTIVVNASL
ncbi:MAG: hypothetical protein QW292_05290 [Candidatus Parvarchaeota archaeon]